MIYPLLEDSSLSFLDCIENVGFTIIVFVGSSRQVNLSGVFVKFKLFKETENRVTWALFDLREDGKGFKRSFEKEISVEKFEIHFDFLILNKLMKVIKGRRWFK
jgi:hypothetical protein